VLYLQDSVVVERFVEVVDAEEEEVVYWGLLRT
jgi:hypothetical protein